MPARPTVAPTRAGDMTESWAARQSQANMQLLSVQNPRLAREEVWAHATGAPEVGGLMVATPDAHSLLGDDRYWQQVRAEALGCCLAGAAGNSAEIAARLAPGALTTHRPHHHSPKHTLPFLLPR